MEGEIIRARFVSRPNRFLVQCEAGQNKKIRAFLPNPGRLWELLLPGATLYLRRDKRMERRPRKRKTQHTVLAVERDGWPIFLHTHETNGVAQHLLENELVPPLNGSRIIQAEVRVGRSRFDFLLSHEGKESPVFVRIAQAVTSTSAYGLELGRRVCLPETHNPQSLVPPHL